MKAIIIILKGILFYTAMIATMLFICSIDSLYDKGHLFYTLIIIVSLIIVCYKVISKEEFDVIVFDKKW